MRKKKKIRNVRREYARRNKKMQKQKISEEKKEKRE